MDHVIEDARGEFLTQKAAARLLGVSASWLRASSAPKLLLPGNGRRGQPLLRYGRTALLEWAGAIRSRTRQDAPPSDRMAVNLATGGEE
jgi:hypothetical protein